MAKYPIYLELKDTYAVVIGAGSVAARKAKTLVATGANVKVVARNIEPAFQELCEGLPIEIIQGDYSKEHLQDAFLVIAATNDNTLNTQIFEDCQALKTLCNVVDVPPLCNFYVPAVVQRGDLQVAISTNGKCPAYASHLRRKFQELITEDHGRFLKVLDYARQLVIQQIPPAKRKSLLSQLADDDSYQYFLDNGDNAWKLMAQKRVDEHEK
jgi:precorrin-2 dehydrogenase/sirohydrochlorin ferrochelatase